MEEKKQTALTDSYQSAEVFRLELTPEELRALSMIMPIGYSLQIDSRRKEKSQSKKKMHEDIVLSSAEHQIKGKPQVASLPVPAAKKSAQKPDLITQALRPCLKVLEQLKQHKCAWPFLEPVDVDGLNIPEYRQIIKQPMDFSTIESKLRSGKYQNPSQFHQDVLKIFHNSYTFNQASEDFIKITVELEKYYYRISGQTKPPQDKNMPKLPPQSSKQLKKKKKPVTGSRQMNDSQPMTTEEKKELAFHLHKLAKEHIKGVRSIVFDNGSDQNEFNLQLLSQKKLRELQRYVKNKIAQMENNMHANMLHKSQQQNLDELESEITEQFIDEPLEDLIES